MNDGRWVELEREWHDTRVTTCEVCGRLIPRRAWVFAGGGGRDIRSCEPECQELYESYVLVTRGPSDADH